MLSHFSVMLLLAIASLPPPPPTQPFSPTQNQSNLLLSARVDAQQQRFVDGILAERKRGSKAAEPRPATPPPRPPTPAPRSPTPPPIESFLEQALRNTVSALQVIREQLRKSTRCRSRQPNSDDSAQDPIVEAFFLGSSHPGQSYQDKILRRWYILLDSYRRDLERRLSCLLPHNP